MMLDGPLVDDVIKEIVDLVDYKTRLRFREVSTFWKNHVSTLDVKLLNSYEVALLEGFFNQYFSKIPEFEGFNLNTHRFKILPKYKDDAFVVEFKNRKSYLEAASPGATAVELEIKQTAVLAYLEMAKELHFGLRHRIDMKLVDENALELFFNILPEEKFSQLSVRTLQMRLNLISGTHFSNLKERAIAQALVGRRDRMLQTPYLSLQTRVERDEFIWSYLSFPESTLKTLGDHQSIDDLNRLRESLSRTKDTDGNRAFINEVQTLIGSRLSQVNDPEVTTKKLKK